MFNLQKYSIKLLFLLPISVLLILAISVIIFFQFNAQKQYANEKLDEIAKEIINYRVEEVKNNFNESFIRVKQSSSYISNNYKDLTNKQLDNYVKSLLQNNDFFGVWLCGSNFNNNYFYMDGNNINSEKLNDYNSAKWYTVPLSDGLTILDPFSYQLESGKEILMTTIAMPIITDNNRIGVVGIDLSLEAIQNFTNQIVPYENSYAFLVDSDAKTAAHPKQSIITEDIHQYFESLDLTQELYTETKVAADTGLLSKFYIKQFDFMSGQTWYFGLSLPISQLTKEVDDVRNNAIILLCVSVIVIFILLYLMISKLINPIKKFSAYSEEIANNNLDAEFDDSKVFSKELNLLKSSLLSMVSNLKDLIQKSESKAQEAQEESEKAQEAKKESEEAQERANSAKKEGMLQIANELQDIITRVTSSSEELSSQIEEASQTADEQQQRITEVSSAMEEMNASILEISRNASDAAEGAGKAQEEAKEGSKVVKDAVSQMHDINSQSKEMKESLDTLGEHVSGINDITSLIEDIADQTNLLALNAAIEAARAGDAGRGFAVVADEVRKLAEKTMDATKNVNDTVKKIQKQMETNVSKMESAEKAVDETSKVVDDAGKSFDQFVGQAEDNNEKISNIATASEEQSTASEEVNSLTVTVNESVSETAKAMQESAQAINDLAKMSSDLDEIVKKVQRENS